MENKTEIESNWVVKTNESHTKLKRAERFEIAHKKDKQKNANVVLSNAPGPEKYNMVNTCLYLSIKLKENSDVRLSISQVLGAADALAYVLSWQKKVETPIAETFIYVLLGRHGLIKRESKHVIKSLEKMGLVTIDNCGYILPSPKASENI